MVSEINNTSSQMNIINLNSMKQQSTDMFSKIDADGNGSIDKIELSSFMADGPQKASKAPDPEEMFAAQDANGDGTIDKEEFELFMAQTPPGPPKPPDPEEMFSRMDANGDGSVDKSELEAFLAEAPARDGEAPDAEALFAEIDTDGDGLISRAESDAFGEKMAAEKADQTSGLQASEFNADQYIAENLLNGLTDNQSNSQVIYESILSGGVNLLQLAGASTIDLLG